MGNGLLIVFTLRTGASNRFFHVVEMFVKSAMFHDEVQSSSVVDSVVIERGVKVSVGVVGPEAKKHFGVLRDDVDPANTWLNPQKQ